MDVLLRCRSAQKSGLDAPRGASAADTSGASNADLAP